MPRFVIAWIGKKFPASDGTGRVHSVFEKAMNLEWDGALVTIAVPSVGRAAPYAVLRECADFCALQISAGDAAWLRGSEMAVGGCVFDLSRAREWLGLLNPPLQAPTAKALADVRSYLDGHASPHSAWRAAHHDPELACLIEKMPAEYAAALPRLVGRGPGLTPSGDDVIVGLLGALTAFGAERTLLDGFCAALKPLLCRTTDVSRQMLSGAMAGDFLETVERCLISLADENGCALSPALQSLCAVGATSGVDIATGIVAGAAYLRRRGGEYGRLQ